MEQNLSNYYNNGFKFNAKELDESTGYYYYGARYYDPNTSIWLSVDPLAEQFPNYGGYVYTFNNPVNLTDPTGMAPEGRDQDPPEKSTFKQHLEKAYRHTGFKHAVDWFSDFFLEAPRQNTLKYDHDVGTSLTYTNGGNENPKTTGKVGETINVDGILDAMTSFSPMKNGNKNKKLNFMLDLINGFQLGEKLA